MKYNHNREAMKGVMEQLLTSPEYASPVRANKPMVEMGSLVAEVVSPEERIGFSVAAVPTPHGLCFSPAVAGGLLYTVVDLSRPRKFILGFYEAVQAVLARGVEQVDALYIGTGPFATLALPATAFFPSDRLVVHAVDINQESLNCLDRVVKHFGVEDSFPSRIRVDASTVDWKQYLTRKPHIVMMECMSTGLLEEPQASIVANLISQIGSDFILVPKYVGVSMRANTPTFTGAVQPFFYLDRTGLCMQKGNYNPELRMVTGVFQAPQGLELPEVWTPHLETVVNTFGSHILVGDDSQITRTLKLSAAFLGSVEEARITYELGGSRHDLQVEQL